jgi:hypothetical protein
MADVGQVFGPPQSKLEVTYITIAVKVNPEANSKAFA